jgi:hypothetical protein
MREREGEREGGREGRREIAHTSIYEFTVWAVAIIRAPIAALENVKQEI